MATLRRYLWIGALVFSLAFLGLGTFFVAKGLEARELIKAELAEENVMTSADAEKFGFGVPGGILVTDAKTAKAQADVIEVHSITIKGEVLKSGVETKLYYADMKKDLFVTPEAYNNARNTYLNGLNLRNALSLAIMGFGVADMAIGTGVMIILAGLMTLGIGVPALYWAKDAEQEVVREVSRELSGTPVHGRAPA